jgi:peptidoglycan/LPS O-acetylase OafA/YrhL
MKKGTSLYLDLVRFSAALTVFLEHFREHTRNSLGAFWRSHPFWYSHLGLYSQTAVIVFFVLSGYVIAHVLATRERTPLEYCASRFGRLYSVVVPALLLVAVCNYFIEMKAPNAFNAYQEFDSHSGTAIVLYYLGTALFASSFWLWPDLAPPNADPFWSLSFEASYYLGIALFVFARGRIRFLSLVLLCAVAGPTMVLLAPTWLLGYGAYHLSQRRRLNAGSAIILWLGSTILLSLCFLIEIRFREPLAFLRMPDRDLGGLLASYAAAMCFAVNMLAFNAFSDKAEPLFLPFAGLIRWLGSMTFALYLFHQPLLSFFTVYPVGESAAERGSVAQMMLLIGGTFLIVATLGRFCEQSKGAYKRLFLTMWGRAATLRLRYGAQTR